jgi:hypothetical protein
MAIELILRHSRAHNPADVSPEVVSAVVRLRREDVLSAERATLFSRVARSELVSVHPELAVLLYGGVLAAMAGVGLLVKQNFEHIGPLAIAGALAAAAALCLVWVQRHASAFSWRETPSRHFAFEYLLLLGVLLVGADLAYVESQFTPLGDAWPWHLLVMSLLVTVLAVRYDSLIAFSLALSTFAAWRGVSVALLERSFWSGTDPASSLRANAIGCGVAFLLLAVALVRFQRKAHFEPAAVHAGWILVLGALATGLGREPVLFGLLLLLAGGGVAVFAYRRARFSLFALGVLAAYIALSALFLRAQPPLTIAALWFALTSLAVLGGLLAVHRRLKPE